MGIYKVYAIRNDVNDKVYIGCTCASLSAVLKRKAMIPRSRTPGAFAFEISKTGIEHFWVELLNDSASTPEEADDIKHRLIKEYDSINNGYNKRLTPSANNRKATDTRIKDITGQTFGRLTVLSRAPSNTSELKWLCRCECGNEVPVSGHSLRRGIAKSCGCLQREVASRTAKSRKKSYDTKSRLYTVWKGIRARCNNPNHKSYGTYGGIGIRMCGEWNDFAVFEKWAYDNGYDENAPKGQCTLDRIDPYGNYCPGNCRWANAREQNLNQRDTRLIEYQGRRLTVIQWEELLGMPRGVLVNRLRHGWEIEEALSLPVSASNSAIHLKKPVMCVETGIVYASINDASKSIGAAASNISMALHGRIETCRGYHWQFVNNQ